MAHGLKCFVKAGMLMEYLYMSMFLQEVGKEINEENIRKIFAALDMEVDNAKVQFFLPALFILAAGKKKKIAKSSDETSFSQQLGPVQKQFEEFKSSSATIDEPLTNDERMTKLEPEQPDTCTEVPTHDENIHNLPARYVYGLADQGVGIKLDVKGLDGAEVYTIPYKEMCIVVHDCLAEPYKSDDETVVKEWLFTQQEVLDAVAEKFGVVLPMSFDMIIEGKNGQDSEQVVKEWLEKNYDTFMEKISGLKGKQEFGVQVFLDTELLSAELLEKDEELRERKKEIDAKPEGIAYMERELLKDSLKEKIEATADQYFREFYSMIRKWTDDIVIGKVKKAGGNKQMLMNLSCLVRKDMVEEVGKELEKIENIKGITVRFSGPWAPYSFVTPEKVATEND